MRSRIRKTTSFLFLTLAIFLSLFFFGLPKITSVEAVSAIIPSESVSISNQNFNASTVTYLTSPSSWTAIGSTSPDGKDSFFRGVISTSKNDYLTYAVNSYHLDKNSGNPGVAADKMDSRVLMVNAQGIASTNGGYRSPSFTLSARSYYKISVLMRVYGNTLGSIYLVHQGSEENYTAANSFEEVAPSIWTTYYFYIRTGMTDMTMNLDLQMGSHSTRVVGEAVFFDNVDVLKLSEDSFYHEEERKAIPLSNQLEIDLLEERLAPNAGFIENPDFEETTLAGWTPTSDFQDGNSASTIFFSNSEYVPDGSRDTDKALCLSNTTKGTSGVSSTEFDIPMGALYLVTVHTKVYNLKHGNGLTIDLVEGEKILDFNPSYEPKTFTVPNITSNGTSTMLNKYNLISFYIKGSALYTTSATLQFRLGTDDAGAGEEGTAIIDSIRMYSLTQDEYSRGASSATTAIVDFYPVDATSTLIHNGAFNSYVVNGFELAKQFPAKPNNWNPPTAVENENAVLGVINTNSAHFKQNYDKGNYGIVENPKPSTGKESDNVLMLWNKRPTQQSVTSNSLSFPASATQSFYELSFQYRTIGDATVTFTLEDGTKILKSWEDVDASFSWKTITLNIKASDYINYNAKLVITFGTEKNQQAGYVFIDNVFMQKRTTMTNSVFETLGGEKLDLTFSKFYKLGERDDNGVYQLAGWRTTANQGFAGLVQLGDTVSPFDDPKNPSSVKYTKDDFNAPYAFLIQQNNKGTTTFQTDTLNLPSNEWYVVSMKIRTITSAPRYVWDISTEDEDERDANNAKIDFGLTVSMNNVQESFKKIKSDYSQPNGSAPTKDYIEYFFYIDTSIAASTNISFTYQGNSDGHGNLATGCAFVTDLTIQKTTKDEFTAKASLSEEAKLNFNIVTSVLSPEQPPADPDTDNPAFNWLLIPSLIFSVVMIATLVTFAFNKYRIKKVKVEVEQQYDREDTVNKDVIRRQADTVVAAELKAIEQKIADIQKDLVVCEEEYIATNKTIPAKNKEKFFKAYANERAALAEKLADLDKLKAEKESLDYHEKIERKIYIGEEKTIRKQKAEIRKQEKELKKQTKKAANASK